MKVLEHMIAIRGDATMSCAAYLVAVHQLLEDHITFSPAILARAQQESLYSGIGTRLEPTTVEPQERDIRWAHSKIARQVGICEQGGAQWVKKPLRENLGVKAV